MTLDTMYSKETNRVRCSFSCLEDLWCPRTPSTLNVSRPKPRLRLCQARDLTGRVLFAPSKTVYARLWPYGLGWNPASKPEDSK